MFRRNSRSCRKRPASTSAGRLALVAEITRTSTRLVFEEPTRSISPISSTRSSFGLQIHRHVGDLIEEQRAAVGQFEAADTIHLGVGECALDVPEQLAFKNAFRQAAGVHRSPSVSRCAAGNGVQRCAPPLPCRCPGSPVIRTLASDGPTREISWSTGCMAGDCAIMVGRFSPRRSWFSASSRWPRRSASLSSS